MQLLLFDSRQPCAFILVYLKMEFKASALSSERSTLSFGLLRAAPLRAWALSIWELQCRSLRTPFVTCYWFFCICRETLLVACSGELHWTSSCIAWFLNWHCANILSSWTVQNSTKMLVYGLHVNILSSWNCARILKFCIHILLPPTHGFLQRVHHPINLNLFCS